MSSHLKERMNIVITGHVDHGKSTLIGRLLADTGSLPQGKLDSIKKMCEKNARPFEYAFLLDALADEQKQGITIDSARVFFTSKKREYIIIDAPGHIEFLKNMISGGYDVPRQNLTTTHKNAIIALKNKELSSSLKSSEIGLTPVQNFNNGRVLREWYFTNNNFERLLKESLIGK